LEFVMMRAVAAVAFVSAAAVLSGCGLPKGSTTKAVRVGCEEASAQAAAPSKASATLFAQGMLKYQIGDLKGYMLQDGYRAVTLRSRRVDCRPYPLGGGVTGLTQCVATARLCSR
jgi:hypothetical protein